METSLATNLDALVYFGTTSSLPRRTQITRRRTFSAANVDFVPLVIEVGTFVHELEIRQAEVWPTEFMFATHRGLQITRVNDLVQLQLIGTPFHFTGGDRRDELRHRAQRQAIVAIVVQ